MSHQFVETIKIMEGKTMNLWRLNLPNQRLNSP